MPMPDLRKTLRRLLKPLPAWQRVPTMMNPIELSFLYRSAREATGQGQLVDLGAWLGGSTAALAAGLAANREAKRAGRRVHSFDMFQFREYYQRHAHKAPALAAMKPGDSLLPLFERHVRPWRDLIEVHPGDLLAFHWDQGPIEVLHVDIMKTPALAAHVAREFFTQLIPGRSVVIHQDFAHYYTGWLHVLMYRLREAFEPVQHLRGTASYVFRSKAPVRLDAANLVLEPALLDPREIEAAFAWSRALMPADAVQRFSVDSAQAMLFGHRGDRETCRTLLERAEGDEQRFRSAHPGAKGRSQLHRVRRWLETGVH
jgi:hypothetical protein